MIKILFLGLIAIGLEAITINDLFNALKQNPSTKLDELSVKTIEVSQGLVTANLLPKLDLVGSYEHFNSPTNLLPVTPKESSTFKNPNIPQPFGKDIGRIGVTFSMPLFVKSLYTTRDKIKHLKLSANVKKKLNFIQKEAMIVGANSSWKYLLNLKQALFTKQKSIQKSKFSLEVAVKNGRCPKAALYKIDEALNQIEININQIDMKIAEAKNIIYELTNINLKKPVKITKVKNINMRNFLALKPLLEKQKASKLGIKASREKLYPSFVIKGKYMYNQTDAYNNDKEIDRDYSSIGLYLKMPIFDKVALQNIQKAKVDYLKSKEMIKKIELSLKAKANNLKTTLPLLEKSIRLARQSVQNQKKLLKIAKVAYKSQRMTEEEYLRYEDALASAKANLYLLESKKLQTISSLGVLYGNNLQRIFK